MKKCLFLSLTIIFTSIFSTAVMAEGEELEAPTTDEVVVEELVEDTPVDSPFLLDYTEEDETTVEASLLDEEVKLHSFSSLGLPHVTILPTSPFYPLKLAWEQIVLFFNFSPEKKAEVTLQGAERRLAEVYRLVEEKQYEKANQVMERYNEQITTASTMIADLQETDQETITQLVRKVEANTVKQQSIADFFVEKAYFDPDAVARIRNITVLGIERAIEALVENNVATPSYELKKRIQEVITGETYDAETKSNVETKMNEKLRREIRKEDELETSPSAQFE